MSRYAAELIQQNTGFPDWLPERMRFVRFMHSGHLRPLQKGLCRWCLGPVPEGRRTWCSQDCVDEYLLRSNAQHTAQLVYKRDRGVCADCGVDLGGLQRLYDRLGRQLSGRFRNQNRHKPHKRNRAMSRREAIRCDLKRRGIDPRKSWWEADHILPVVEGGGCCGLENYRTLCQPCHRAATAVLRRRLARRGLPEQLELMEVVGQ